MLQSTRRRRTTATPETPSRSTAPYLDRAQAEDDPLFRALTFEQVMKRTDRSRRTITAWIAAGLLTPYLLRDGHRVQRVFLERQVLEVHRERRHAAAETRLNLRHQKTLVDASPSDCA